MGVRRYQYSQVSHTPTVDQTKVQTDQTKSDVQNLTDSSFAYLFENSKFAQVLNPVGRKFKGEVITVVGSDLYIDFGWKFHAVVRRPEGQEAMYAEGTKVVVLLKDLEMTLHPLGSSRDISLLEAEVELCGLA